MAVLGVPGPVLATVAALVLACLVLLLRATVWRKGVPGYSGPLDKQGRPHGTGKLRPPSGSDGPVYEGEFKSGKFHGQGRNQPFLPCAFRSLPSLPFALLSWHSGD